MIIPPMFLLTFSVLSPADLAVLIGAIGVAIANIIAALKTRSEIAKVATKTDVIVGHVNSAATAQATRIEALQSEVRMLNELLADKSKVAAVLAQSVANGKKS